MLVLATATSAAAHTAQPTPESTPTTTSAPTGLPSTPTTPTGPEEPVGPAALNSLIDPALLEGVQSSIVGLVTVWEEPQDPWAFTLAPPAESDVPAISLCTGWFDTPTTIVTAGHCVDPAEGRLALDAQNVTIDPATGDLVPPPPNRSEPTRTVWAFQPRELPGAVITAPTIVRVDAFRPATEGDTAKLDIFGLPPAAPIPVAATTPRLGEPVWSIGFPGLNIAATDGINILDLVDAENGSDFATVLQESRIQPVITSGSITSRQYRDGVAVYQTNADLASGTSGGPTINSRGEVYGLNSQMTLSFFGQNYNIITDTGMLREFLEHDTDPAIPQTGAATRAEAPETDPGIGRGTARGAAPEPARASSAPVIDTATQESGEWPAGWLTGLSAAGCVLLGGVAVSLWQRRRPNRPETRPENAGTPRHRTTSPEPAETHNE
jgi:hypothetical protein